MEATIEALAATAEMRDPYTAGHQRHVAELAVAIAQHLGLEQSRVHAIHLAAIVHDIGKIKIPTELLTKPTRLTSIESQLLQTHVEAGYDILKNIDFPWPIAEIVRQHHERLDGSGYPQHLRGDHIHFEARILAVADVVDAMSAHRPYRFGLGLETTLESIEAGRGTLYDADVVDACLVVFRNGFAFSQPSPL
jgi:putative nucleotidyltransferase with HDIG domain